MKRNYNLANQGIGTLPTLPVSTNRPASRFAKRVTLAVASLFIFNSAQTFAQTEFCVSAPDYVDGAGIKNVSIGSINNTTGLETPNYGDYTSLVVNLGQSTTNPISITLQTFNPYNVKVWVDWNNNNNFEAAESVFTAVTEDGTNVSGVIAVPGTATLGNHRMRVGITPTYAGVVMPCYSGFDAAAYEDYTVNVTPTPTCFTPGRPVAVNTGIGSINISWAAPLQGGTPSGYEYAVSATATPPSSGTAVTTAFATGVTVPTEATGFIFVRANCGNGNYSEWVSGSYYNGVCIPSPDYVSGQGITNVTLGTINNETLSEDGNYGNYSNLSANVGQSVTQPFSITFSTNSAYAARIWVDWNNDLDFDDEGELVYSGTSANRAVDILRGTFTVPANASLGAHRLRIGGGLTFGQDLSPCLVGSLGTFEDYTLNVTTPPSCFTPLNPTGVNVAAGVANLSWTAPTLGNTPAGYEYAVTTTATPPASGTAVTTASATGVTVTANTLNYIHVRTNCGSGDFSNWITGTLYNGYCTPEPGYVDGDGITNFTLGTINNTSPSESMVYYENYTDQVAEIGQGVSKQFSISFHTYSNAYATKIWVDWNNDLDFDDAGEEVYSGTSAGSERAILNGYITVPLTATLGNHRLRIGALPANRQGPVPCSNNYYGVFEDYTINVIAPPSCYAPANFTASSQGSGFATVSWSAPVLGTAPAGYEYALTATGEAPAAGTATTATTLNNFAITPNATNYLHVRTNCGGGDFSEWLTVSLYNGYCIPAPQTVDINGITNVNIGSINNTTDDQEVYSDFSEQVANIGQGVTQQFSITLNTGNQYNIKMWVDFNDNLIFEEGELLYDGVSPAGTISVIRSTFTIPATAPLGNHRLRIAGSTDGNEVTPCDIQYFGAYEDYTINVTVPPTCFTPLSPTAVVTASNTANLSWTAPTLGDAPAGYEYVVDAFPTIPQVAGTMVTTTSVTGYTGFEDDTYYYLHVRTSCGDGDFSEWVVSEAFRYLQGDTCVTAVDLITLTSPYSFSTAGAANNYTPNCGTSFAPDIYYSIVVPNGETLNIGLTESGYDAITSLFYGNCTTATPINCVQGSGETSAWENTTGAAQTVYWVMDGNSESAGTFTFEWSLSPPPACNIPRALNVSLTSLTSGNATWTVPNTGTPAGYEYAVSTSEDAPETGTYTTATSATVTVTPNVVSYLHVRTICSETDGASEWVTYTFFSGYCVPGITTSEEYFIAGVSTAGGVTNFTNSTPAFSSFTDYTATHSVSIYAGGSFSVTATTPVATDTYLYGVWIDWNGDYDFTDNGERLVNSGYLTSPAALGNITVPVGTPVGNYRMRVRNTHTGVLLSPCDEVVSGSSQDYTLTVVATPSCFPPSNPVITVADAGYANLGWNPPQLGGTPSGYEYVFSPTTTVPTGNGTFTDTFYVGDVEYNPAQSVYLFVRSVCGGGEFSNWVGNQILGTDNPQLNANNVIVYKDGNAINITSGTTLMTSIAVYDTRGRMLYSQANINSTQTTVRDMPIQQQVIIVEVTTAKGKVIKRIVF